MRQHLSVGKGVVRKIRAYSKRQIDARFAMISPESTYGFAADIHYLRGRIKRERLFY